MAAKQIPFRNFSGGLNTRDGIAELAENEFPYSWNVTIDERGEAQKRLGYVDRYDAQIGETKARSLNGTNQYYTATDHATLDTGDTFSVLVICKRGSTLGTDQTIISKGTNSYVMRFDTQNRVSWGKAGVAFIFVDASQTITDQNYHMYLITKSTTTNKYFFDGVQRFPTMTNQTIVDSAESLFIGRESSGGLFLNGSVDEVIIFDDDVSANAAALYAASIADEESWTNLVTSLSPNAWYRFETNNPLDDSSANNNTLTAFNAPTEVAGAVPSGLVSNLFSWDENGMIVAQVGKKMYADGDSPHFHEWTTSERCSIAAFGDNLFMQHPTDGLWYWPGTGATTNVPSAPDGNCIMPWQNRLWAIEKNTPRLWYSPIGDPTAAWPGTNWVDLKEKDSDPLTCLAGAAGIDISGRPGLLVFKADSAYRVHDSVDGDYTTLDVTVGCPSNIGAVTGYGRTYVVNTRGIFWTDGINPFQEASQLIENFFHEDQINQNRPDLYCAGQRADRFYFSLPRSGQLYNSIKLELHPLQNWVVPHSDAASCYATRLHGVTDLVFGSPTVPGRVFTSHTGGSDNGAAISSTLQLRWIEPAGGNKARIRRARFVGYGAFDATLLTDYATEQSGITLDVDITSEAGIYDDGVSKYDDGITKYGPLAMRGHQDFWSLGTCYAMSILIQESSTLTGVGREIIDGNVEPEVGAWTLSHIWMLVFDLGTY